MKKLLAALAMVLLFSLTLGIFLGQTGYLLIPLTVKAATEAPHVDIVKPNDKVLEVMPKFPYDLITPTPTPKWQIVTRKPLELQTKAPVTAPPDFSTPTPQKDSTPKPSTGGGKYMTSEGPLFLSFRDNLTEQLYMFTPMDLSIDTEYHFPLIGSSEQVVGDAKVQVASGMVTVNYFLVNGVDVDEDDEFFTFFKDIDSITTVKPSRLQNVKLKFGVPYNVETRMKTDPNVLLYINCPVTYKTNLKGLSPFSFDDPQYLQRVAELVQLMD